MFRLATILLPTDFSLYSEHAFEVACSLARDHAGRVIVLHVAEPPVVVSGGMVPPADGAWQALDDQLNQVQPAEAKVSVEHRLEEGNPVTEILRVAQESQCDLIVMGTHGRTGLAHLLMGSVAEKIVRKAACSVLIVKPPFPKADDPGPGR